ncbi:MAG TPA: cupin domain-containing protein [Stenotrophomonas sp.]|nr:cupin domain-containing protein [Stenotrophomonas sp.]
MDAFVLSLINRLGLAPHPEGGHYRRCYESALRHGARPALTAIHYLLVRGERSRWHRVDGDECWHWQQGGAMELRMLDPHTRALHVCRLGAADAGETPMQVVPAGWWQAARPLEDFSLVACTVSPGFVWEGFTLLEEDDALANWLRSEQQWP